MVATKFNVPTVGHVLEAHPVHRVLRNACARTATLDAIVKRVSRTRRSRTDPHLFVAEYFQCRSNGRFVDVYSCVDGKYFECIHYHQSTTRARVNRCRTCSLVSDPGTGSNPYGMLLSRSCPTSLRFNSLVDRCDYPQNVKCLDA
jgi:hypothetical protein